MDIAERLKKARIANNMTVYKLSQISGISETHIRDLERGDRNPSFDTLSRLAKPLRLSMSELFNESEEVSYLDDNERELLSCFRSLDERQSNTLLDFLKTLK